MANELDVEVGNIESSKLIPSTCFVQLMEKKDVHKKTGELVGTKIVFGLKHPDSQELISVSNLQYLKNKSVTNSATWFTLDKEMKLSKNSALAAMMKHYRKNKLSDFENSAVDTVLDESGYLVIKAY